MEYESVTQKGLFTVDTVLQNAKKFNMRAFLSTSDVQTVFHFRPSVLQHLRCNSFNLRNNTELEFVEGVHWGLAKKSLKYPAGINQAAYYRVSAEATELAHHGQPSAQ
jgi:hypothetical protein